MKMLNDYINNFKTILELGKLDEVLFDNNTLIDKTIFLEEVKKIAEDNCNKKGNPVLTEEQFSDCLYSSKILTIKNALDSLVKDDIIKEIIAEDGTISYQINDTDQFPDWLKDII